MRIPGAKSTCIQVVLVFAALLGGIGGSNASAATTVITNVIPDVTQSTLFIYGQNFCTSPAPQVYMFVPPSVAVAQLLPVTSFSAGLITATIPAASPAGIYLFFVNCSGVFTGFAADLDPLASGTVGATGATGATGAIGATGVGTTGPTGATGVKGATGANGATGATGAMGTPGSAANVSVVTPLASTGGSNPVLSLPHVRIDTTNDLINTGNTASGYQALKASETGRYNTASGYQALAANAHGLSNTADGYQALSSNFTGSGHTAIGYQALFSNTTGGWNTASGYQALFSNVDGGANTVLGYQAAYSNTSGGNNTVAGIKAFYSNTTGFNNEAIGASALGSNTTGYQNMAVGVAALYFNTTGTQNAASGNAALYSNTSGQYNTAVGFNADVARGDLRNATAIGANAIVDADDKVRIGNAAVTVIEGQVAYTFTSDRNQKERFEPIDGRDVLRKLRGLPLTTWNYIGQDPTRFRHYGPMAQDFFAAFGHDAVGSFGTDKTINSGDLAGVTLIAVQAVADENEALKKQVAAQEERIGRLEALLEKSTK